MPIKPNPFTIKCTKCSWSKRIYPKSDVVDSSWGIQYVCCPKCGAETVRAYDTSVVDGVLDSIKRLWS